MATSTGQYARVLVCRTLLPDREAWQATVYRVAKSWTQPKRPCAHRCKAFFVCGSSAPVRAEHVHGTAAWLAGALMVASLQGHELPLLEELWPYQESLFEPLVADDQKASVASLAP